MNQKLLELLEEVPCNVRNIYIKIAETDFALKELQKTNPAYSMADLREYNAEAKGYERGFADAMKKVEEWRNKRYLELKNFIHADN